MDNNSGNYPVAEYPLKYNGNVIWPVLFLILFPPLGLLLLILNLAVRKEGTFYSLFIVEVRVG
ncbi:MAG: hypothetical protein HWD61_00935 [Parachlamydiaceae bacterium]|nr:MAG: hypothetical protein HWD61_00935 [Parachlamydiaceae bacterium]